MQDRVRFSFLLAFRRTFALVCITLFLIALNFPAVLQRKVPAAVCEKWFRWVCKITGIEVSTVGQAEAGQNIMFVCNHVSYIDIPILGSVMNGYFVAKSEVQQWPVFGFLSELHKTVFIERRGRKAAEQRNQLSDVLVGGKNLILFPEGTSSDGSKVLPFKSTLFEAAYSMPEEFDDEVRVQPVSIAYKSFNGQKMSEAQRENYAWYGEMTLPDHFWHWLGLGKIGVEVSFHQAASIRDFEDRKKMAVYCEEQTRKGLESSLSD